MKPTNYHLFDFLDFDTELSRNESLWKAYKPTAVYEKEGDIYVTVPFQKQKLANDLMADTDVPQEEYMLIIRQYNIGITRLFLGFGDYVLTDESEMLQFSDRIQKVPLFIKEQKGKWILSTEDGTKRAVINVEEPLLDRWSELLSDPQETLDITLYPDGKREIRLSAYDHFSPPRYDALPVAFCKRDGRKERATLSFECKPDECFAGTGERFFKMDLSGHTFFYLFVIIGIGMIVVSLWDKSPQLGILNMEKIEDKPARIVLILWGLLIVTMIGLYIFFNGH